MTRTYLATDGASALVIDPQRDVGRVLAVAAARGAEVTHVFETHIHNNYVSGGLALGRQSGAADHVNAADAVAFSRVGISDGDTIAVGRSRSATSRARSASSTGTASPPTWAG